MQVLLASGVSLCIPDPALNYDLSCVCQCLCVKARVVYLMLFLPYYAILLCSKKYYAFEKYHYAQRVTYFAFSFITKFIIHQGTKSLSVVL